MQYCSLQHWALLPSPVTSTTGWYLCIASISSFFLKLFLHWSLVAYWAATDLGSSSFSVLSFCFFITVHGVLKARVLKWLPFPSPVDRILSELSTMTLPSWVSLHGMAHSFIELDKAVVRVIKLSSFLWLWFTHANYFITSFKILLLLSCSIVSDSLKPCRLQHARLPCPSPSPRVSWNSCSLSWWWHPTVSSSVAPFYSCP